MATVNDLDRRLPTAHLHKMGIINDRDREVAACWKRIKTSPSVIQLEMPSIMKLLGTLGNGTYNIVDLGCGEGFYCRKMKELTKGRVVGVDISPAMIDLAKRQNVEPAEYLLADCSKELRLGGAAFDIVTANYLLDSGKSKEAILAFCKTAFALLKPGGKFLGANLCPFTRTRREWSLMEKYCFLWTTETEDLKEGHKMYLPLKGFGSEPILTYHYWSPETYAWAFKEAGFVDMEWVPMGLGPVEEEMEKELEEHWKCLFDSPALTCFKAKKPVS